jgi:hypothetical protein
MEGIYFFGDYQRWNLGWSNPNQAGVFVAMWIPWLWGLQRLVASGKRHIVIHLILLAAELVLWFLLCKTYSRGALVAVVGSGVVFLAWHHVTGRSDIRWKWMAARVAGVAVLLAATGFFSRIDPRFVSQDASAGNRLTLWKGGLQMISASPWQGWGVGNSGPSFMHWFQRLDADEAYAGMVNSYLHVGVERGLPVLAGVIALAVALLLIAFHTSRASAHGRSLIVAAGCSWLVFLIANGFSTLWIFEHLWWLPAASALWILVAAWTVFRRRFLRMTAKSLVHAAACAVLIVSSLALAGRTMADHPRIKPVAGGDWIQCDGSRGAVKETLILPDATVLGETWGKEVRRLAGVLERPRLHVPAKTGCEGDLSYPGASPEWIIACGKVANTGFSMQAKFPEAGLILLHPLGRPAVPEGFRGKVTVILPMLDTSGYSRLWRASCRKQGWKCLTSPGVGQDIRRVWPGVLSHLLRNPDHSGGE